MAGPNSQFRKKPSLSHDLIMMCDAPSIAQNHLQLDSSQAAHAYAHDDRVGVGTTTPNSQIGLLTQFGTKPSGKNDLVIRDALRIARTSSQIDQSRLDNQYVHPEHSPFQIPKLGILLNHVYQHMRQTFTILY